MSNSRYFSDTRKSGEAPEKSIFEQTCNLLSQYLKKNGSLRDLNLGINGKLEAIGTTATTTTTLNLLSGMEKSGQISTQHVMSVDDHFTNPYARKCVGSSVEDGANNSSNPATMEPETAQMTIIYAGQVYVFDNLPAEKAREVRLLASKGSSPNTNGGSRPNPTQACLQPQPGATGSADLPMARRRTLYRFFEKRKAMATARAPYQVHNPSTASPKDEDDEQLELKL